MIVGGWTRRLIPLPGELLSSCLARNAYAHGSTPYRFLGLFWHRDPVWERDFDRAPAELLRTVRGPGAPDWLDDVAGKLCVPRETVEQATLAGLRERLGGPKTPARGDTPLVLSAGVHHRVRTRHALQFCPECLDEGVPHFRREWRLGFVACCETHGTAMLDACPHCGANAAPHRSMTTRVTDCHRCGLSLARRGARGPGSTPGVPPGVAALQRRLLAILSDHTAQPDQAGSTAGAPWRGRAAFDVVRSLMAVSTAPAVHRPLRAALDLAPAPAATGERARFEQARLAARVPMLETAAAWASDWPRSFRHGAEAAGLTKRTFSRKKLAPALAAEVRRLPPGVRRDRTWVPLLDEPVLNRLRRTDPAAYRQERARRILNAVGAAKTAGTIRAPWLKPYRPGSTRAERPEPHRASSYRAANRWQRWHPPLPADCAEEEADVPDWAIPDVEAMERDGHVFRGHRHRGGYIARCVDAYRVARDPALLDVARKDLEQSAARYADGLSFEQAHWLKLLDQGAEAVIRELTATTRTADFYRWGMPSFGRASYATRVAMLRRNLPPWEEEAEELLPQTSPQPPRQGCSQTGGPMV